MRIAVAIGVVYMSMRFSSLPGFTALLVLSLVVPAWAQQYSADKPVGTAAQSTPAFLKKAGISQNLGNQLPLNDRFVDSSGANVPWVLILNIARW